MATWTDPQIVEAIQKGGYSRDMALYAFFKDDRLKNEVLRYVVLHGGDRQRAEDVFQDAVIIFDRNVRRGLFEGREGSSLRTYFVAIAKWHWVNLRRKTHPTDELQPAQYDAEVSAPDVAVFNDELRDLLSAAIARLGKRCQEMLQYVKLEYSNDELAQLFGLSSTDRAKKEKYRCFERLRDIIAKDPYLNRMLNLHKGNG